MRHHVPTIGGKRVLPDYLPADDGRAADRELALEAAGLSLMNERGMDDRLSDGFSVLDSSGDDVGPWWPRRGGYIYFEVPQGRTHAKAK